MPRTFSPKTRLAAPSPWRFLAVLFPLVALPFCSAAPAAAQKLGSDILPTTCRLEGVAEPARCFELEVPENPAAPNGRRIGIHVAILPATDGSASEPPLFALAGGPGQDAGQMAPYLLRFFEKGRRRRDIVLADVRGTGLSHPLDCKMTSPLAQQGGLLPAADIDACRERLAEKADLRYYTTYHAMGDLDRVREALGAEQIVLWGGSYGTRAAMVYQKLFPQRTRAVVLDGSAPYEVTLPAFYARDSQRALDLLFARCAADTGCSAMLPEPRKTLDAVLAKLETAPQEISLAHPRTGEPTRLTITRGSFASTLRTLLYGADGASFVPFVVHRAAAGDFLPLASTLITLTDQTDETMYLGFTFSVLCSEDQPFIDRQQAADTARGTFLGTYELDAWTAVCSRWPRTELPADFAKLPPSQVPALLLSGEIDPVVPPSWGEVALASFPRGRHLIVPGAAHNTSHLGCTGKLIEKFLDQASTDGLDASCLDKLAAPPFVTSFAGAQP